MKLSKLQSNYLEYAIVIVFAISLAILNSLHVIIHWYVTKPGEVFAGIAHYFADYFLYVAQMAQGVGGNLLYRHAFTNEYLPPTWIYWFNLFLGNIGHILGLSPFATYNVSLVVLVFGLLLLWYYLCRMLYPRSYLGRITCFLLIVTASSIIDYAQFFRSGTLALAGEFWFSPTPAFNRLGGVPHQVLQTILLVGLTLLYASYLSKPRLRYLAFLSLLIIVGTVSNPVQMVVWSIAAAAVTLWSVTTSPSHRVRKIASFVFLALFAFMSAYLTNREFDRQAVFARAKSWEATQFPLITFASFLVSIGPVAFLAPLAVLSLLRNFSHLRLLLFTYGLLSFLFFVSPIPRLLGTTPVRYLSPASYALLPVLATEGLLNLSLWLSKFFSRFKRLHVSRITYHVSIVALYLFFTLPSLATQVLTRMNPATNPLLNTDYNHIPQTTVSALTFLKNQPGTPQRAVVFTDPRIPIDVLVPAMSGKISFTGHPLHTLYSSDKENLRQIFFRGAMGPEEAAVFLKNHRIGFLMISTRNDSVPVITTYPGVRRIYANATVVLFAVNDGK